MGLNARHQIEDMLFVWSHLRAMDFNRDLQRRWLAEAQRPAFPLPERIAGEIYRRRLSSWAAALGPIKHGWG